MDMKFCHQISTRPPIYSHSHSSVSYISVFQYFQEAQTRRLLWFGRTVRPLKCKNEFSANYLQTKSAVINFAFLFGSLKGTTEITVIDFFIQAILTFVLPVGSQVLLKRKLEIFKFFFYRLKNLRIVFIQTEKKKKIIRTIERLQLSRH